MHCKAGHTYIAQVFSLKKKKYETISLSTHLRWMGKSSAVFWQLDFTTSWIHWSGLQPIGCMCSLNAGFPTRPFSRSRSKDWLLLNRDMDQNVSTSCWIAAWICMASLKYENNCNDQYIKTIFQLENYSLHTAGFQEVESIYNNHIACREIGTQQITSTVQSLSHHWSMTLICILFNGLCIVHVSLGRSEKMHKEIFQLDSKSFSSMEKSEGSEFHVHATMCGPQNVTSLDDSATYHTCPSNANIILSNANQLSLIYIISITKCS